MLPSEFFVEWDEGFQTARLVFADKNLLIIPDEEHSAFEERYKVIGKVGRRKIILVVCTDRTNAVRIISARQANIYERGIYLDNIDDGL